MPLGELIRYFNATFGSGDSTLYDEGGRIAAWHDGMRLGSLFAPIVDLRNERIVGHQASLAARLDDGSAVSEEDAYARSATPEAIVPFDRLVRTLHALNFLSQSRHAGGFLLVPVHARHLRAVSSQHGLIFEAILKRCGLAPEDIILELDHCESAGCAHLAEALGSYRQRGYRLALCGIGSPLVAMQALQLAPDVIRLPAGTAEETIALLRQGRVTLLQSGIASVAQYESARAAAVELGEGALFGEPQAACRATHGRQGVAYNSHLSIGA